MNLLFSSGRFDAHVTRRAGRAPARGSRFPPSSLGDSVGVGVPPQNSFLSPDQQVLGGCRRSQRPPRLAPGFRPHWWASPRRPWGCPLLSPAFSSSPPTPPTISLALGICEGPREAWLKLACTCDLYDPACLLQLRGPPHPHSSPQAWLAG